MTMKFDGGKPQLSYILEFPRAVKQICKLSEFGSEKYARGNWRTVENGFMRYTDAMLRHMVDENADQGFVGVDKETKLLHAVATAWNALARLELLLAEEEQFDLTTEYPGG